MECYHKLSQLGIAVKTGIKVEYMHFLRHLKNEDEVEKLKNLIFYNFF